MDIRFQTKLRLRPLEDVIRALRIMEICPCSPDVGDCSKCRNPDGSSKRIQTGSFTNQTRRKYMKHALKTNRRAQLVKNIKTSSRKTSRRK
jgi:hypothetical protein